MHKQIALKLEIYNKNNMKINSIVLSGTFDGLSKQHAVKKCTELFKTRIEELKFVGSTKNEWINMKFQQMKLFYNNKGKFEKSIYLYIKKIIDCCGKQHCHNPLPPS